MTESLRKQLSTFDQRRPKKLEIPSMRHFFEEHKQQWVLPQHRIFDLEAFLLSWSTHLSYLIPLLFSR